MRGDYQFVSVSATAQTITVAPPLAGHRVRLVACALVASAAATVATFQSQGSTSLTGDMTLAAGSVFVLPFTPSGWLQTVVGQSLTLEVAANTVAGCAVYEYLPDDV